MHSKHVISVFAISEDTAGDEYPFVFIVILCASIIPSYEACIPLAFYSPVVSIIVLSIPTFP